MYASFLGVLYNLKQATLLKSSGMHSHSCGGHKSDRAMSLGPMGRLPLSCGLLTAAGNARPSSACRHVSLAVCHWPTLLRLCFSSYVDQLSIRTSNTTSNFDHVCKDPFPSNIRKDCSHSKVWEEHVNWEWYTLLNPTLGTWEQENQGFKASLNYMVSLRLAWAIWHLV